MISATWIAGLRRVSTSSCSSEAGEESERELDPRAPGSARRPGYNEAADCEAVPIRSFYFRVS